MKQKLNVVCNTAEQMLKNEIVLVIATLLAAISAFFVHPDQEYITYIDFRTVAILFCLMAVMAGLQKIGLFQYIAGKLLGRVKHIRELILILVMLSFFFSMIITNDVALITFVPFSFIALRMVLGYKSEPLVVPIVVLQTVAANLGSMLTPIGNPQNLYLYGKVTLGFGGFILLMLPYTLIAFGLLAVWCVLFPYKGEKKINLVLQGNHIQDGSTKQLVIYGVLFILCILTVAHVIPYEITLIFTVITLFIMDKGILKHVDYALLFTFVAFFIFIGNMGRIPAFSILLGKIIEGNVVLTAVVSSQFISNVPAALLLSGFTQEYEQLIVGTNLGGLGTLIASMASLISFKYIAREYGHLKGKYMIYFTGTNIAFLIVLLGYVFI